MGADRLYLDHVAGTPLLPAAREAMLEVLSGGPGNPSSPHAEGREAKDRLEAARTRAAKALGCRPRELVFTSGATEALDLAIQGLWAARGGPGIPVVLGAAEHPAVADPMRALAARGAEVREIPVDRDGRLDRAAFVAAAEGAAFAALGVASHELGTCHPVSEVGEALSGMDVPILCEASLAPGRLPVDLGRLPVAVAAFGARKFGGPAGSGLLFIRRGVKVEATRFGGRQEEGLRPGEEAVANHVGLAVALEAAISEQGERADALVRLAQTFRTHVGAHEAVRFLTPETPALPGLLTLGMDGVEGEALMINLDLLGIAVATGSTCALGGTDPSPGLLAMGYTRKEAAATVRVSMSHEQTDQDMGHAASSLCRTAERLLALAKPKRRRKT